MAYFDSDKVRQSLFIVIIALLGILLFRELQQFIPALLGAITLYVLMRNHQRRLVNSGKWKPGLAALLLMMLSFVVILFPILLVINLLSSKVNYAIAHSGEVVQQIKAFVETLEQNWGIDLVSNDSLNGLGKSLANLLPSVLGATFNTLTTLFMMYFMLYFMLTGTGRLEQALYRFIPMEQDDIQAVGKELRVMVVSNAVVVPLIAIIQGVVGLIGYLIIGVKEPMLWFAVTCITGMLPIVGAAVAYVPLAILFFVEGNTAKAIIMLAYGFGVIGTVDNLFRFTLARKIGNIHPLITVFGVIIGVNLFGFIGLVFGPLLISMFILLVSIYNKEFHRPAAKADKRIHLKDS